MSPHTRADRSPVTNAGATIGLLILVVLLQIVDDDGLKRLKAFGDPGKAQSMPVGVRRAFGLPRPGDRSHRTSIPEKLLKLRECSGSSGLSR